MSPNRKRFLRDNLSGLSLTLIGLLCAAAVTVAYLNRSTNSPFVLAQDKALGGPGISALQTLNKAYEQIARAVTPAIVSIQSTQVGSRLGSPRCPHNLLIARTRVRARNESTPWAAGFWSAPMGIS